MNLARFFNTLSKHLLVYSITLPIIILCIGRIILPDWFDLFYQRYTIANLIFIIIISPVLEETVFRGLLQDLFLKYLTNKYLAIFLLNLLFCTSHIYKNSDIIYLLFILICGIIFSMVKYKHGWLYYPIGLHMYYNLLFVIFSSR